MLIKTIRLGERTSFKTVNFHITTGHNCYKQGAIRTIIELEDSMVLNSVTKFDKILIKCIRLRERTSLDRRTYGQG